jgi:hypothetical protein
MNTKTAQNLNEAQKAYRKALKDNQALLHKIERALLDAPAACNGNWGMVGDQTHLNAELQEIVDRLYHTGEYSK